MGMWVKMHQLAKRLDTGDHAGKNVFTPQLVSVNLENRFPSGTGQVAQ
jgi:hypothetical protein